MQERKIEILKLIKYYATHGKKCDREYIMTLIELITQYRYLEDYINLAKSKLKSFSFKGQYAIYLAKDNIIYAYSHQISKFLKQLHMMFNERFTPIGCEYKLLLAVLEIIAHETEHANEKRIIESGEDSLKREILELSMNPIKILCPPISESELIKRGFTSYLRESSEIIKKVNMAQKQFYTISPHEVIAEAWADEFSLEILRELTKEYGYELKDLYHYNYCLMLYKNLKHYSTSLCPTFEYFKAMGLLDSLEIPINLKGVGLSLDERMLLGLEISSEELRQKREEYNKTVIFSKM